MVIIEAPTIGESTYITYDVRSIPFFSDLTLNNFPNRSLGILIFEMMTGVTPFYEDGMEQMDLFRAIVNGRYKPHSKLSEDANNIVKSLLIRNPSHRLGSLAGGEDDIFNHLWLRSIDFDRLLLKELTPPKVPKVEDPLDASNFEDWSHLDDKRKMKFPKLTVTQKKVFEVGCCTFDIWITL